MSPEDYDRFFTSPLIGHLPHPESFVMHGAQVNAGPGGLDLYLKRILTMHPNTDVGSRSYHTSRDGFWSSRSESGAIATYTIEQPAMLSEAHLRGRTDELIGIYAGIVGAEDDIWLSTRDMNIHSITVRNHGAPSLSRQRMGPEYQDTVATASVTSETNDITLETDDTLHFRGAEMSARNLRYLSGGNTIDDALMVESQLATYGDDYSALDRIIDPKRSKHTGEESITAVSGDSQYWTASRFHSPATSLIARTSVFLNQAHRQHFHQSTEGSAGGLFESGTKTTTQSSTSTSRGVEFTAPEGAPSTVKIEAQTGDITLTNGQFLIDDVGITAMKGAVRILQGTNSEQKATVTTDASPVYQTTTQDQESHHTLTPSTFRGNLTIRSKGTVLQQVEGQVLEFTKRLNQQGGEVTYELLKEFHDHQSQSHSGPTAGLSMVVALAMTIATGGSTGIAMSMGKSLASTLGATGTMGSVVTVAGAAGFTGICSQAAVAVVANQGNILEAARQLASTDTLKSLAMTMVTAGIVEGIFCGLDMSTVYKAPPGTQAASTSGIEAATGFAKDMEAFLGHLNRETIRGVVGASVGAAFGEEFNAGKVATGIGASTIGAFAAGKIGASRSELGYVTHKALHGILGAVTGGIVGGSKGALGGAIGGIASEVFMEASTDLLAEAMVLKQQNPTATAPQLEAMMHENIRVRQILAEMTGIGVAAMAGGDVGTASMAAHNAAHHNFAMAIPLAVAGAEALMATVGGAALVMAGAAGVEALKEKLKDLLAENRGDVLYKKKSGDGEKPKSSRPSSSSGLSSSGGSPDDKPSAPVARCLVKLPWRAIQNSDKQTFLRLKVLFGRN